MKDCISKAFLIEKQIKELNEERLRLLFEEHNGKIPLDLFAIVKGWTDVVYAFPNNGYPASRQKYNDQLTVGKRYRVFDVDIGRSSSSIKVYSDKVNKEIWVNSVMFCQYHPLMKETKVEYEALEPVEKT